MTYTSNKIVKICKFKIGSMIKYELTINFNISNFIFSFLIVECWTYFKMFTVKCSLSLNEQSLHVSSFFAKFYFNKIIKWNLYVFIDIFVHTSSKIKTARTRPSFSLSITFWINKKHFSLLNEDIINYKRQLTNSIPYE